MRRMRLLTLILALNFSVGCVHRSVGATNVEDPPESPTPKNEPSNNDHDWKPWTALLELVSPSTSTTTPPREANTAPAPQQVQAEEKLAPLGPNPKLTAAERLYSNAEKDFNDGAYLNASRLWLAYIDGYPGFPGYEQAHYDYAYCVFALGRPAEAVPPLRVLIQSTRDPQLGNDARILMAESLLTTNHPDQYDEALALTYEVLPDAKAEKTAGLGRSAEAVGAPHGPAAPTLVQKIRLYTLRGRVFASLKNEDAANSALKRARALLEGAGKAHISPVVRKKLTANWAWRQIEVLGLTCQNRIEVPEQLSEAEFLAYADAYYGCAAPARPLFCKVFGAGDEQIQSQALASYRDLVEAPLALRDHLPPPARQIRKKVQRPFYEREMKALIEKTVHERSKEFKNLDFCGALDLF